MKFSDVLPGESFVRETELECRFIKIDEDHYQLQSEVGDIAMLTDFHVSHVGVDFDLGHALRPRIGWNENERWSVVWTDREAIINKDVTLTDLLNAGWLTRSDTFSHLVALPASDDAPRLELSRRVVRVDHNTFRLALTSSDTPPVDVIVTNENSYSTIKGKKYSSTAKIPTNQSLHSLINRRNWEGVSLCIKHFIANEYRYAGAKTLVEHEIEFLNERRSAQPSDEPRP